MKNHSKFKTIIPVTALLLGGSLAAQAADKLDLGRSEYNGSCAVCHGYTGKGDGPMKPQLTNKIPDLTALARNNKGVFPFDRVYQIIDGREEVKAHGTREMPVWGRHFNMQDSIYFENYPPQNAESAARSRILALTEYLYRLQSQ